MGEGGEAGIGFKGKIDKGKVGRRPRCGLGRRAQAPYDGTSLRSL